MWGVVAAGWMKKDRLSAPLMFAFREAHEARDAKIKLDLRDDHGERIIAGRRAGARRAITEAKLRREVTRDLDALMNAINFASSEDIADLPEVQRSILNHGFPDVAHRTLEEISVNDIRNEIRTVLAEYEPRLARDSIQVLRDETVDEAELRVRFVVRAVLSCDPVHAPIEFVAEVEVDTGKIVLSRR